MRNQQKNVKVTKVKKRRGEMFSNVFTKLEK
jgi:hypothetical protein